MTRIFATDLRAQHHSAAQRRVEASAPAPPAGPVDMLGIPLPPLAEPVRLVRGKPPERWSRQERDDAALYALGGRFAQAAAARGIPAPPGASGYYIPSPNDPSVYDEKSGEWLPKQPW